MGPACRRHRQPPLTARFTGWVQAYPSNSTGSPSTRNPPQLAMALASPDRSMPSIARSMAGDFSWKQSAASSKLLKIIRCRWIANCLDPITPKLVHKPEPGTAMIGDDQGIDPDAPAELIG